MAQQAADLAGRTVIKLKLGAADGRDADRVAAVRAARPDATLYVDANAGWSPEAAVGHIEALAALVIRELVSRTGVDPNEVEEVYFGCANQPFSWRS